jgi:transcriptional regulator with XRE-family HTH domain
MPSRIGPRRAPRRIFLAEWRESRGFTQKQLGERVGVSDLTVSRWERTTRKLSTGVMDGLAEALGIEPQDFYHHPDRPSPDALLRGQPADVVDHAIRMIQAIRRG